MFGTDTWLEGWLHGSPTLGIVLLISLILGLRHASDPDHLAAVTTLLATEQGGRSGRKAALMGLSWGLGHATTLVLLGLLLVRFNHYLPEAVQRSAEAAIGGLIVLLALRLLYQWHHGHFHAHRHHHPGHAQHCHVHAHLGGATHAHGHASLPRTPLAAYGIGLVHGVGGSAGLTLLVLSTIRSRAEATTVLLLFAAGTAVAMAILSAGLGWLLARGPIARHCDWAMPLLGGFSLAFGVYYTLGALSVVSYPL
jgi:ABC-type nickel/cobalt efflux system permease component RcnA